MPVARERAAGARDNKLNVTGSDLEVVLVATCTVSVRQPGDITAPGRGYLRKHSPASSAQPIASGSGERSGPSTCPGELTPENQFEGPSCRSMHQARC